MLNGRYRIIEKIGEGRCKVFLISDSLNSGKEYAMKLLQKPFDADEEKIFYREYLLLERIDYPGIIKVNRYETVVDINDTELLFNISPGSKFFVMEYFDGKNLLEYINTFDEKILMEVISQLCHTLYYLHQSNYIYADLKPENILIKFINGIPEVKLIDLGFSKRNNSEFDEHIQGSIEYIAPEILRKEQYNHRADLYSLGMVLYRFIYKKFPFETSSNISIIKAHLEEEAKFPKTNYSKQLIDCIKKLLKKNPAERYECSLEILGNLGLEIKPQLKQFFLPVAYYTGREEITEKVLQALYTDELNYIIVVKGETGSGKTMFAKYLKENLDNVLNLDTEFSYDIIDFWKNNLRNYYYNSEHCELNSSIRNEFINIIDPSFPLTIDKLKNFLILFSQETQFILLIDDYNKLIGLNIEFINQLIPVFFSNNIKLILIEDTNLPTQLNLPIENKEFILPAFNDEEVKTYFKNNFNEFFPEKEIRDILAVSADLNPGNIINFLRQAIEFEILDFSIKGPVFCSDNDKTRLLKSSQEEIVALKYDKLSREEVELLWVLSSFEINIDVPTITFLKNSSENLVPILQRLINLNFISLSKTNQLLYFTSQLIKDYIYENIPEKEKLHLSIAKKIIENIHDFKRIELARHFELGGELGKAYEIYIAEIIEARKISAYSYIKGILEHLLTLALDNNTILDIKLKLSSTLMLLGEYAKALEMTDSLLTCFENKETKTDLIIQKGKCLIALGEINKGIADLNSAIHFLSDNKKLSVMLDIAGAYIDVNRYKEATYMCEEIINYEHSSFEEKANAYNLLALTNIYQNENLDSAISNYNQALIYYKKTDNIHRIARMELNLGNIYNMRGNTVIAQKYWNDSLQKNLSVGDIEQESKLLINLGISQYNKLNFEQALTNYKRAQSIFISLGDRYGEGLALLNQGESFMAICEYESANNSLSKAQTLFSQVNNKDAEADALSMMGELYYELNCVERLETVYLQLSRIISEGLSTVLHNNNLDFLEQLLLIRKGGGNNVENKLFAIKNLFASIDEKQNYIKVLFLLSDCLIKKNIIDLASELMNDEILTEELSKNRFIEAKREYYLGIISIRQQEADRNYATLKMPIEHFERAYSILENESINELLYRIMFEIAKYYFKRGNYKESETYIFYCKNLIYFISENISNQELKECYLKVPVIEDILNSLRQMESKIY